MKNGLYTVIAVDDEIWALRGLCNIVDWESAGFTILGSYTDSSEALKNITEQKPDIVFTDIRMPGIDGMELIEAIHNNAVRSRLVIVSAYRDFDVAKRAIAKDVTDYLMKPLDKKEVAELLSRLKLSLDKENSEKTFDIKHFDLSKKGDRNNLDVIRFLDQQNTDGFCRIIVSDKELEASEGLNEIFIHGYKYSYLCSLTCGTDELEAKLSQSADNQYGISRVYSSYSDLETMLSDINESYEGRFIYSDNSKISEIQDYLSKHYSEKTSLPEIAEHFFVSESYLYELFRKNTDTSVVGFIKNIRLNKARTMLAEGGLTVGEIAETVGYPDLGYFGKLFKTKYGCTPEQYATGHLKSPK